MSKNFAIYMVSFLSLLCPLFAQQYRTLESADGRSMEAELILVSGDEVRVKRKADGRSFKMKLDTLSAKTQTLIREWDEGVRLARKDALKVSIRRSTSDRSKGASIATKTKKWRAGYTIQVTNETMGDIKDLKAEYRIFMFDQKVAASDRKEGKMERKSGTFEIKRLVPDESFEADTETFELSASELKEGWYYYNGGRTKSKDELGGCWVRLYKGEKIVHEYALPASLMRKEKW